MILVDTSIWVEIFRTPRRLERGDIGDEREIVTCLPVIQEVLQGLRDESDYRFVRRDLLSLPLVEAPLRTEVAPAFRSAPSPRTRGCGNRGSGARGRRGAAGAPGDATVNPGAAGR